MKLYFEKEAMSLVKKQVKELSAFCLKNELEQNSVRNDANADFKKLVDKALNEFSRVIYDGLKDLNEEYERQDRETWEDYNKEGKK